MNEHCHLCLREVTKPLNQIKKEDHVLFLIDKSKESTLGRESQSILLGHVECIMFFPNIMRVYLSGPKIYYGVIENNFLVGKCTACDSMPEERLPSKGTQVRLGNVPLVRCSHK